jgi:putative Mn2+ efflux pump MntP
MGIGALMLLALGISMDNLAVSLEMGTANPVRRVKEPLRVSDRVRRLVLVTLGVRALVPH